MIRLWRECNKVITMEVKTIKLKDNLTLHFVPTNKFKIVTMNVVFQGAVDNAEISNLVILTQLFNESCEKYPDYQSLTAYTEYLYRLDFSFVETHYCESDSFCARLSFIAPRYLEPNFDIVNKVLDLVNQIVYHPLIKDGVFDAKTFAHVQQNVLVKYRQIEDVKEQYMEQHLNDYLLEDHPYKHRSVGNYEELAKATPASVYACYLKLLQRPIDVYIVGDVDETEIKMALNNHLMPGSMVTHPRFRVPLPDNQKANYEVTKHFMQSVLAMVYLLPEVPDAKCTAIARVFNMIFGGSGSSKLFKVVREEHNFCYSISSLMRVLSDSMVVMAGIDAKNRDETLKLVNAQLQAIADGKISDEEMLFAKETLKTIYQTFEDNGTSIINAIINDQIIKTAYQNPQIKAALIDSVTKADVIEFAKQTRLSYTFFLRQGGAE